MLDEQRVENGNTEARRGTIAAIAQCKSTLEIHKAAEGDSAPLFLHKLATVYDTIDAEVDTMESHDTMEIDGDGDAGAAARSRAQLFADIPVPFSECRRAWVEDCAFVHRDPSTGRWECRLPSPAAKLLVWKKIFEGALLQGISLEEQFLVRDLWKAMLDEDAPVDTASGPFPKSLFEAVVRRLTDASSSDIMKNIDSGLKCEASLVTRISNLVIMLTVTLSTLGANLDKDRTVAWVGEIYLETTAPNSKTAITRKAFLSDWANLLPEKWCTDVSVDQLKASNHFVCQKDSSLLEQQRIC